MTTQSVTSTVRSEPNLTAEQVFACFSRPRRTETDERSTLLLAQARTSNVLHRGLKLATWTWGSGPRALLMHGWDSRASHLAALVPALTAAGLQVVAFDAPGHGDSEGDSSSVVDFGRAILAVNAAVGGVRAVIGHSVGSAAALYAFAHGLSVQASVHVAGPASLARAVDRFADRAGLPRSQLPDLRQLVATHIGAQLDSMDLDVLSQGLRHPALLLHDSNDREVPYTESAALNTAWPGSRLIAVEGLGHRRIIADPGVAQAAADFIALRLRPPA